MTRMRWTWVLTVLMLISSRALISLYDKPWSASTRIRDSVGLSGAGITRFNASLTQAGPRGESLTQKDDLSHPMDGLILNAAMEAKKLGNAPAPTQAPALPSNPNQSETGRMPVLRSKDEAAEAVKQYAHLVAELGVLIAARKQAEVLILEKYNPAITAKVAAISEAQLQLKAWAEENRPEFGEAQSLEFSHGTLQFRMGSRKIEFRARWDEQKTLAALLKFPVTSQWREYLRIDYSIDRQELLKQTKPTGKLPEARLGEIGLKIVREEGFSIEPKPEAVANDCDLMP